MLTGWLSGHGMVNHTYPHLDHESQKNCRIFSKMSQVSSVLRSCIPKQTNKKLERNTFSPLRFIWLISSFIGARGQLSKNFPAVLELSSLNGSNGFMLFTEELDARVGHSVSSAGDVNGDGIDDFLIGAPNSAVPGKDKAGKTFVVFGSKKMGMNRQINLAMLDGTDGFSIDGEEGGAYFGASVSKAGDFNNDGIDDLIIGADGTCSFGGNNAGKAYVIFGAKDIGNSGLFALSRLAGPKGFGIYGENADDDCGRSVAGGGDVNGDNIPDIVIGAPYADHSGMVDAGKAYVIFGGRSGESQGVLTPSKLNGFNGFVIKGANAGDFCGFSVSNQFDVNGDGMADITLGGPNGGVSSTDYDRLTGNLYVVYGGKDVGKGGIFELSNLTATTGFVLLGDKVNAFRGYNIAGVGDVNGDGMTDMLLGNRDGNPSDKKGAGKTYVLIGGQQYGSQGVLNYSSINTTNSFHINGEKAGDHTGRPISYIGDINGDGISDVLISGKYADPSGKTDAGITYVLYGGKYNSSGGTLELSNLDVRYGFKIIGEMALDNSGGSVSSAGDINGDGARDLLIGAFLAASPGGLEKAGRAYVIFGHKNMQQGSSTTQVIASSTLATSSTLFTSTELETTSQNVLATPHTDSSSSSKDLIQTSLSSNEDNIPPVTPGDTKPLNIIIAVAATAFACSILSGGFYFFRRKREGNNNTKELQEIATETNEDAEPYQNIPVYHANVGMHPDDIKNVQTPDHSNGHYKQLVLSPDSKDPYTKAPLPGGLYGDVVVKNQVDGTYDDPTSKLD